MSDERARLFVALTLPPEVREKLARWRDQALGGVGAAPGLRPVPTEALHVTLCFLGWRAESEMEPVGDACALAGSFPVVRLSVGDPVWLPARRPRVLGVSLEDAEGRLVPVQAELSRELSARGLYAPEPRPFFAHVTVARVRKNARIRPVELPAPPPLEFESAEVTLFRSRLFAAGARYEPITSVTLGSAGPPVDPIAVVRRFHEAQAQVYAGGSVDQLREVLREDVIWHVPGRSAIAGEHRGIDAVLSYLDQRCAMTDATFRVTVHGAAIVDDRVVQLAGGVAERGGAVVSWESVGVFRVLEGRIAECWLVPFDLYAFDQIWS